MRYIKWQILLSIFVILNLSVAQAAVTSKAIEYKDGDTVLQGYLYWDDSSQEKRPGVIVVHEWWGLNDYVQGRARQLAELGYVAFALDMYGKGQVTEHAKQAGEWSAQIQLNTEDWQRRALKGLEVLHSQKLVDTEHLAAIGYCFGGSTVMQMAYSGADLDGVVSFHGSMPVPTEDQASMIRTKVLIEHGSEDGFVPAERLQSFEDSLNKAKVDWKMDVYGGAVHGFTNPAADQYAIDGLAYNEEADHHSWTQMKLFFDEVFNAKSK